MMAVEERFWAKVDKSGDCWIWTAYAHPSRDRLYGQFTIGRKKLRAHRFSYEMTHGEIPDGYVIDHICHNTLCVKPAHLQAVTVKENGENRSGPPKNSSTGVRGVTWNRKEKRFIARVKHDGRLYQGGRFLYLEDAAQCVVRLRNQLHTNNLYDEKEPPNGRD